MHLLLKLERIPGQLEDQGHGRGTVRMMRLGVAGIGENAVTLSTCKVCVALDGAVVLAGSLIELNANQWSTLEVMGTYKSDGASTVNVQLDAIADGEGSRRFDSCRS